MSLANIIVLDPAQADAPKFVTRQHAAEYCDVSPDTVARWADKFGLSVAYDPEGRPRYLLSEVQSLITAKKPKEYRERGLLEKARSALRK